LQPGIFNAANAIGCIMVLIDIIVMMSGNLGVSGGLMMVNQAEAGKQTMGSHRPPNQEQEDDYHGFKPSHEEEINLNTVAFNLYLGDCLEVSPRKVFVSVNPSSAKATTARLR
jgi:hypothetical protein